MEEDAMDTSITTSEDTLFGRVAESIAF